MSATATTSTYVTYTGTIRRIVSDDARQASFNEIPVLDASPVLTSSSSSPEYKELVAQVRDACTNVGFFYIKNHGVEGTRELFEEARNFFKSLNEDERMEVFFKKSPIFRGYEPVKKEGTGDLKAAFMWGYEPAADPANASQEVLEISDTNPMQGPNMWPTSPRAARMKPTVLNYYGQILSLQRRLIRVFAAALDLPETFFDEMITFPGVLGRILHYPPQPPTDLSSERGKAPIHGINAHTDIELFTILLQDDVGGLQVLNKNNEWVEAEPKEGTFVVNIGDMLSRWSNDVFVSTLHRVINGKGTERFSAAVFFGPNYDTDIRTLESCITKESPSRYEPIRAGEYVWKSAEQNWKAV